MADIAASVLARLKNKAAESGRSYQLCLQLFCQEEFLRRLEKSRYAENLVLKGGLFILEFSSRMKDYYDIYYLANKFDFDGKVLTEALRKTFENREHNFTAEQFKQVMSFHEGTAMQKKWKAFVRKIDTKTDDYSTVLETMKAFLTKPFTAAVAGEKFTEKWSAMNGNWI